MGDLTGQTVASTYSQLLNVASLDGTFRNVTDGDGTASGLTLSTGGVRASLLNATDAVTFDTTLGVTGLITASGGVTGNVTGDLTGDATGDLTGNIKTTDASAAVTTILNANVGSDDAATFTGNVTGNVTGSADTLTTGRTVSATGDIAWTSPAFDGSEDVTAAATISDDAVTTAKILDNQVTGAKIAMGSDAQGDILYYDGTDYVRLGAGTSGQVLQSGGTEANPSWVDQTAQTPSVAQVDFFTYGSGSSQTWTVPSGVTRIRVSAVGGGGGGNTYAYAGGGGGFFEKAISVTAGTDVTYTVGSGGTGVQQSVASSGTASTVVYDGVTYTAGGGGGAAQNLQGAVGVASNGDININGFRGGLYKRDEASSGTYPAGGEEGGNCGYSGFGRGGDGHHTLGKNGESGFVKIEY